MVNENPCRNISGEQRIEGFTMAENDTEGGTFTTDSWTTTSCDTRHVGSSFINEERLIMKPLWVERERFILAY